MEQDGRPWGRDGYAVEDFGLSDNLMIVRAIEEAGGSITLVEEPTHICTDDLLAAFWAFEACLGELRKRFDSASPEGAERSPNEALLW